MARAEQLSPRARGRLNRPRAGVLLRSGLAVFVAAAMVPVLVLSSGGAANAGGLDSVTSNPGNAWVIEELAADAISAIPQSPEVSNYERSLATTATVGTTAAQGLSVKPKAGGKLGMILNTVAVLGGLAAVWPGGDDAPPLPSPVDPSTETFTDNAGSTARYSGQITAMSCGTTSCIMSIYSGGGGSDIGWGWEGVVVSGSHKSSSIGAGVTYNTGSVARPVAGQPARMAEARIGVNGGKTTDPGGYVVVGRALVAAQGTTLPAQEPGTPTDPALVPRYIDSEINCKSSSGATQTLTRRDGPFTFDPSQPYTMPEVPDMVCPEGTWLKSGGRKLHTEGTDATQDVPLVEPYEAPGWVEEQATKFPDCFPVGAAVCQLKLYQLPTPTHPEYDCHAYAAGSGNPCADWYTDPKRKEHYECRFGASALPFLRRCEPYKDTFSVDVIAPSPSDPDTDADPTVGVDPTPQDTPNLGGCVPNWSELLSPWWVFKAQACALKWAFVPRVDTWGLTGLKSQLEARPPFSLVIGLGGTVVRVGEAFSGAGGCGMLADFSSSGEGGIEAPVTCQAVRDSIPGFTVLYTMMQAALWVGWGIYVWRYLSGLFERGN